MSWIDSGDVDGCSAPVARGTGWTGVSCILVFLPLTGTPGRGRGEGRAASVKSVRSTTGAACPSPLPSPPRTWERELACQLPLHPLLRRIAAQRAGDNRHVVIDHPDVRPLIRAFG